MKVYAWGRGEDGQLGLGDGADQYRPRLIESLCGKDVTQVVCGSGHTVVLSEAGQVFTWGRGDDGRLGHGDHGWKHEPRLVTAIKHRVSQITCGSYHTAAVTDTGELFTWGGGMYGKLGHGSENGSNVPRKVDDLSDKFVIQVACGSRHTVALVSNSGSRLTWDGVMDTDVYAWGDRDNGVAGHGEHEGHQYNPRRLDKLVGQSVCQIAACGFHTAAVTEFGKVFSWGEGKFGRLGHASEANELLPRMVEDEKLSTTRIIQIACGGFHTAAITDQGKLFTWGGGEHGQLGHGNKENCQRPTMVKLLFEVKLKQVTCGWSHTVVLTDDGEVWSFGNGDHGKLGHGDVDKVTLPKRVEGLVGKKVCRVASYNEHTAALAAPDDGPVPLPSSSLIENFRALVDNPMFSDVTFIVEGKRIHAHRIVLAARSAHFQAMFRSGMKESREPEITIRDTRAVVFLALMNFLYTDVVDVAPVVAIELFVLADLYALDRLKAECEAIVYKKLCHHNAPELLSVADQHSALSLKSLCTRYIIQHFEVITKSQQFTILNRELILEILQRR